MCGEATSKIRVESFVNAVSCGTRNNTFSARYLCLVFILLTISNESLEVVI
jgi:hypothetical protein